MVRFVIELIDAPPSPCFRLDLVFDNDCQRFGVGHIFHTTMAIRRWEERVLGAGQTLEYGPGAREVFEDMQDVDSKGWPRYQAFAASHPGVTTHHHQG